MEDQYEEIDPQRHERLCAWMFDEMPAGERPAFEAELANDAKLQAEHQRLAKTVGLVRQFATDDEPMLAPERHAQLTQSLAQSRADGEAWTGYARLAAAAAVLLAAGGGIWWSQREAPSVAPHRETAALANTANQNEGGVALVGATSSGPNGRSGRSPRGLSIPAAEGSAATGTGAPQPAAGPSAVGQQPSAQPLPLQMNPGMDPVGTEVFSVSGGGQGPSPRSTAVPPTAFDSSAWSYRGTRLGTGGTVRPVRPGSTSGPGPERRFAAPEGYVVDLNGLGQATYRFEHVHSGNRAKAVEVFDPEAFFRQCRPGDGEQPRDMYFRFWGDNAFERTRSDALATFAADVDTASFVLARRYLRDGVLPQKAQIRTEEFVNYFDPDLAPPTDGSDFAVHAELAPSLFGGSSQRYLMRVGLRAREIPVAEREPLALTFVVDTSGSMKEGQRLELVKHALMTLVSRLDERDRIGLVSFSSQARLVLPMTEASKTAEIAAVVQGLSANGGTNAEAGLKLGYDLAATGLAPERLSRVVFLSDGVANVGQTDQNRINADVAEQRESGILLNTIGVGMGNHNDVFLEQLANKGDGVCDYVDDARSVHRAIVERFAGALQPVAADVKIQVEFDGGQVLRWRQIGYENRAVADNDFRNDAVDAGEVGSGHQVTALFELETASAAAEIAASASAGDARWATVRVRWLPPRRAGQDPAKREAKEIAHRVDAAAFASFADSTPGFRRATLVAQFAEVLRRSSHAAGDSFEELKQGIQTIAQLPEFADDEDTIELVTLLQQAEGLGIRNELERDDLAKACEEYKRTLYLTHQIAQFEKSLREGELDLLRIHNVRLEQRIRELNRK
ncbi:MAG: von Willebrand factor type A domain-containing protein [Planctomycetota bacterium]